MLYASLPARATHEDSLRDSRRGARMLGGEPQGSGVLVLAVARGFSAANLVVSAKCAAAGRPFWRPRDATQAREAAATCCRWLSPGCSSPTRCDRFVRRVAFFGRRRGRRVRAVVAVTQARAPAEARRRRPRLRCCCCCCRDVGVLVGATDLSRSSRCALRPPPRAARASGCGRHAGARSGCGAPPAAVPAVLLLSLPR